nr:hypothetical protein [Flavobacterium sp. RSP49]
MPYGYYQFVRFCCNSWFCLFSFFYQ